ncbi:MAG: lipoyl(octanoyl) transferase LipB, partial [Chloroflexi bacterium]|nr:lipoyl(octanoyl) transferase LipB [Chloroflexota bacterium]
MAASHSAPWHILRPGRLEYGAAWRLQQGLVRARQQGRIGDVLILLEHPPTYTIGRRGTRDHVLLDPAELARQDIAVYEVDRGGEVTYHGPGQLVGYPILDLRGRGRDVHTYVHGLEAILIRTLGDLGIAAATLPGIVGVWVGLEKIAALGVRVSRGVTSHGFALNVTTNLDHFTGIIPCGITDKGVTSLLRVLGRPLPLDAVADAFLARFLEDYPGPAVD